MEGAIGVSGSTVAEMGWVLLSWNAGRVVLPGKYFD